MKKENGLTPANRTAEISIEDLRKRISERETQIDEECGKATACMAKAVKLAFSQGQDLIMAKNKVGHGDWMLWVSANFPKTIRTANRYMLLASNWTHVSNPECDLQYVTQGYRAIGVIPSADPEVHQLPSLNIPPIFQKLISVSDWLTRSTDEVMGWNENRRHDLKAALKPVVEFFERL